MCYGPVKIRWDPSEQDTTRDIDDRLVILLALDLIVIDGDRPKYASVNQYDFYILAKKDILAQNAELCFWFPFRSKKTTYDSNNQGRASRFLKWQLASLAPVLEELERNPTSSNDGWVIGWDEESTRELLSIPPSVNASKAIQDWLNKIASQPSTLVTEVVISQPESTVRNEQGEDLGQLFVFRIAGPIKQGTIFHVFFELMQVEADEVPEQPCAGQADLYYYDRRLLSEYPLHPFAHDPSVPVVLSHVAMLFPTEISKFTPTEFAGFRRMRPERLMESPTGHSFRDGRWFIVFNAHKGIYGDKFHSEWVLSDCLNEKRKRIWRFIERSFAIIGVLSTIAWFILALLNIL